MSVAIARNGQFSGLLVGSASGLWAQFLSIMLVLMAGLSAILLRHELTAENVVLVFIPAILVSALLCDLPAAIFGCLASAIAYNVLFLPPLYTFTPKDPQNALVLVVFMTEAVVVRFVAARMRAEANKARDLDKIAERERLQAALLASISHDLRTPLASILGSASSLKLCAGTLDEAATLSLINTIQDEAGRLNRFIANLLDMTRLESGAIEVRADLIDLADIFGSALRRVEPLLPASRITLEFADDLPELYLDAVLFEQVLFNLFDNVAKYAPHGSPVVVEVWQDGGDVHISIADKGDGLPPDQLEHVFDKFHRVATEQGAPSTGLGLSICRGFVEALGGRIKAGNRAGGGAVFMITLPILSQPVAI